MLNRNVPLRTSPDLHASTTKQEQMMADGCLQKYSMTKAAMNLLKTEFATDLIYGVHEENFKRAIYISLRNLRLSTFWKPLPSFLFF